MTTGDQAGAAALEFRALGKTYGRGSGAKRAVDDVSLIVRVGEVYGFLGPTARARAPRSAWRWG